MAYLAFDDTGIAPVESRTFAPAALPVIEIAALARAEAEAPTEAGLPARLSALEWAVVALARRDTLGSLRHPGRLAVAMRAVFRQHNPRLADERLEALRRIAVLGWHHGFTVPSREVKAFLTAGFSADQYETLMASIGVAKRQAHR